MLNSKENSVSIEGLLSEVDLKESQFTKNGVTSDIISGEIKIRTSIKLHKEDVEPTTLEIPVRMFANKKTKAGAPNPAYAGMKEIMTSYTSIAASDEAHADAVRIDRGNITMQEYYSQRTGKLVSFPSVNASFIRKVPRETMKPTAEFSCVFAVANKGYELDKDGVETDKYCVTGILPKYNGTVDVVKFYTANKNVTDAVDQYWNQGDTVRASGKLNFSATVETVLEEVDFGEPIEKTRTVSVSDLLITGGSSTPMEGEFAFDQDDIVAALAQRKAYLAELKEKGANRSKPAANAAPAANTNRYADLGF